jgi:hypothetical protein
MSTTGTRTEMVSVDGNYGKVVSRTEATLPDTSVVQIVGIEFPDGTVHFCEDARVNWVAYNATVDVDYDAVETLEEAACSLIDWIRTDQEGPIYVHVHVDRSQPAQVVAVTFDENGSAVGTLGGPGAGSHQ